MEKTAYERERSIMAEPFEEVQHLMTVTRAPRCGRLRRRASILEPGIDDLDGLAGTEQGVGYAGGPADADVGETQ